MAEKIDGEAVAKPATKAIYAYCSHCAGTGKISLSNGEEPPVIVTCNWCGGFGKTAFGEIET